MNQAVLDLINYASHPSKLALQVCIKKIAPCLPPEGSDLDALVVVLSSVH